MRNNKIGSMPPKSISHVLIQNGHDSMENIESKSDAFEYLKRQIQNVLSLFPLLESQCYSEERKQEKENDCLLTVEEAAEFIKVSRPTVYDLINSGDLPCYEFGQRKQKRIWKSDLIKLGSRKSQ